MVAGATSRYTLAELRFIAARVIAHVRANPSTLPLLTERPGGRPKRATCRRGHADGRDRRGVCVTCERARLHRRRKG